MDESKELVVLVESSGMEKTKAQSVLESFTGFFKQASEWEAKTKSLVITDVSQIHEMKMAREGRLQLKEIRVAAEKTKKKLKENILIEGRFIDSIYNLIAGVTTPLEAELLEKEKFVERKEQARKDAIKAERIELLAQYEVDSSFYNLSEMPDDQFGQLLENSRLAFEARKEVERIAEADRIAREKAEIAERARIAEENVRLKAEAEAREKAIAAEKKAREESERIERQRRDEEERKARQAAEAEQRKHDEAIRAERAAADKARRELQAKLDAEAAEKKAREEESIRLATAGDMAKMSAYIKRLQSVDRPVVVNQKAIQIIDAINALLARAALATQS